MELPEHEEHFESVGVKELVDQVFSKPPMPPHTIHLNIENPEDTIVEGEAPERFMVEFWGTMALYGIDKLFGREVHVFPSPVPAEIRFMTVLGEKEFKLLQEYMASFGVKLCVYCNADYKDPWETIKKGEEIDYLRLFIEQLPLPTTL